MSDATAAEDALVRPGPRPTAAAANLPFILSSLALSACMFASLLLALAHFDAIDLPGCGAASDCTRAAASRWGRVPGTEWPLSFVGFAYFQALAAAFVYGVGMLPRVLRSVVVGGAAVSTVLTTVMIVEGYVCGYCLTIHVLNIAFATSYEFRQRLSDASSMAAANRVRSLAVFAATFAAASLLLAVVQYKSTVAAEQQTQTRLQQALRQAAEGGAAVKHAFGPGRYSLGPETAPVHIVVVSDYQCPSCRTIDAQLAALVAGRADFSISVRHFPFCTDCNAFVDKTRHPNACRAALAAEAAGIVGGADAFWRMHDWLFERRGEFTDEALREVVKEMGLDLPAFLEAMQKEETLQVIRSDAAAADAVGLRFTPMIFINGKPLDIGQ